MWQGEGRSGFMFRRIWLWGCVGEGSRIKMAKNLGKPGKADLKKTLCSLWKAINSRLTKPIYRPLHFLSSSRPIQYYLITPPLILTCQSIRQHVLSTLACNEYFLVRISMPPLLLHLPTSFAFPPQHSVSPLATKATQTFWKQTAKVNVFTVNSVSYYMYHRYKCNILHDNDEVRDQLPYVPYD